MVIEYRKPFPYAYRILTEWDVLLLLRWCDCCQLGLNCDVWKTKTASNLSATDHIDLTWPRKSVFNLASALAGLSMD